MSLEDILRSARKSNGEPVDKSASPPTSYNPPPEHDEQDENGKKNWYKKTWCIILFLVIFYPVGLILLWLSPRKSFQLKSFVTVSVIFLVVYFNVGNSFATRILYPPPTKTERITESASSYKNSNTYDDLGIQFTTYQGSYGEIGYLKKGVEWLDGRGDFHYNSRKVKVEIGKQKIVASDGRLTQIYFLEGDYAGVWGYVSENFLSR